MNEQNLPNSTTVLVLGILSILCSCCCSGLISIALSAIGLSLYRKDETLYKTYPNVYNKKDYDNLTTGRVLCIIGLVIAGLMLMYTVYELFTLGWDGYQQKIQETQDTFKEILEQSSN